ncbi:MAG: glycosidase, partial [Bacilli bacterium]
GRYYAYHRPVPKAFGHPDIYIASSNDLLCFGLHEHVLGVNINSSWENTRIGGGAPSIKTKDGWLAIYHAANQDNIYSIGAFLTPLDDPTKIIAQLKEPLLKPEADYEINGFFNNVVFTCGVVLLKETLFIYYGGADCCMAVGCVDINDLLNELKSNKI